MKRWVVLWTATVFVLQATPALAPTFAQAAVEPPLVSKSVMAQWSKVGWCESHLNWTQVHYGSHAYSGALGIRNDVWAEHGGLEFGATAGHATPEEQVLVARRIQARAGIPNYVPDQTGCAAW